MTDVKLIYETVHGSRAYNLSRHGSDTDYKGIIVGPSCWYFGFKSYPVQIEKSADHVQFEIRKFFKLAAASNPTVIEMLWTNPKDHVTVTAAGKKLLDSKHLFLSKRIKQTFAGYAVSQLKRIKTHRQWLLNPPKEKPSRAAFGLLQRQTISKEQLGAAVALEKRQTDFEKCELQHWAAETPNFLELLDKEKRYFRARQTFEQYQVWLKYRNPVRAALEAKFGYDTKHAMHLVRLQRMAVEILRHETVWVQRPDRDELLAIRDGVWSYDNLIEQCEQLDKKMTAAMAASKLPDQPDDDKLEALCVSIVQAAQEV